MLLGAAPHLNMAYTVFGEVTQGLEMLSKLEEVRAGIGPQPATYLCGGRGCAGCPQTLCLLTAQTLLWALLQLPTRREGLFVMPLDRITILSTYTCAACLPACLACGVCAL